MPMIATPQIRESLKSSQSKLKDLGWANAWKDDPPEVKACKAKGHHSVSVDVGPPHRGLENVVVCEECGIVYRVDSSD